MSPVRKFAADGSGDNAIGPDYFHIAPKAPVRWGLPLVSALAALLVVAAVAAATFMLVRQLDDRRDAVNEASALGYTSEFMVMYTSLDPFNANAYADRVAAQAAGEFAKNFGDRLNEILVQVARSEPSTGEVLAAGVQRWNDDGSADVLIATKVTSRTPDGKYTVESGSRWVATTIKEGQQWKISNLVQVI
ncbi:mammalian cell entry protein [Mycobacterium sp. NAZ190054]|uniref:mammalian cell entry protein n=1 Tax=Mycobacterium sp. NAZ190054 TaxID=1747766 RepID=UPI00079ABF1C|nr:mammalian cell entry protein [Mycobacterium sp. NAZ190054]KWX66268.1 mammalian cell entry protein [Mycobacterium sp. NAZ190054]